MCDQCANHQLARRGLLAGGIASAAGLGILLDQTPAAGRQVTKLGKAGREQDFALVALGVKGGPPPIADYKGISTALIVNNKTYLIDCGRSSLTQFVEAGLDISTLAGIFITHLHMDHIVDYMSYIQLCGGYAARGTFQNPIFCYGPGTPGDLGNPPDGFNWLYNESPGMKEMTRRLLEAYGASANLFVAEGLLRRQPELVQAHDIEIPAHVGASPSDTAPSMEPFQVMTDENITVTATLVPHGKVFPSFAYRFDTEYGSVTFSGDTGPSDNLIHLAKNTDVLLHEAGLMQLFVDLGVPPAAMEHYRTTHTDIAEIGRIAREANARSVILTHIAPEGATHREWTKALRDSCRSAGYRGSYHVAQDGENLPLPARRRP